MMLSYKTVPWHICCFIITIISHFPLHPLHSQRRRRKLWQWHTACLCEHAKTCISKSGQIFSSSLPVLHISRQIWNVFYSILKWFLCSQLHWSMEAGMGWRKLERKSKQEWNQYGWICILSIWPDLQLENSRGHECSSIGKLFSLSWHSASMVNLKKEIALIKFLFISHFISIPITQHL